MTYIFFFNMWCWCIIFCLVFVFHLFCSGLFFCATTQRLWFVCCKMLSVLKTHTCTLKLCFCFWFFLFFSRVSAQWSHFCDGWCFWRIWKIFVLVCARVCSSLLLSLSITPVFLKYFFFVSLAWFYEGL